MIITNTPRPSDKPGDRLLREHRKVQVGGTHYSKMKIQPLEYILANGIGFSEGNVIKYVSRWESKGGVEDLKKARDFLDKLIAHVSASA